MERKNIKYTYNPEHFNITAPGEIVPYLINTFHPQSIIDVGCGKGTFLHAFLKNNVSDVLGVDGSWINRSELFIPEKFFLERDLEKELDIERRFDMALCLEVAEHLSESSSDTIINSLTKLSDLIIFSAAIKNQKGQHHVNEQSFDYWVEKFEKKGFVFYDIFRKQFWNNSKVNWWYKQNMFLVMRDGIDVSTYKIEAEISHSLFEYIHPELFALRTHEAEGLKRKLNWIKQGKAPGNFYLQQVKRKIASKLFRPSSNKNSG